MYSFILGTMKLAFLSHPLEDSGVKHTFHLKLTVDFLLVMITQVLLVKM